MNVFRLSLAVLALATIPSANAQTVPQDVRCLVLSNAFSKSNTAQARESARATLNYFAGRLDGLNDQVVVSAMRAQARTINPATAPTEMAACATRLLRSLQRIQNLANAAKPAH